MIRFALSVLEDSPAEYRLTVRPLIDPDSPLITGFPSYLIQRASSPCDIFDLIVSADSVFHFSTPFNRVIKVGRLLYSR